jgi:hypothetical protein
VSIQGFLNLKSHLGVEPIRALFRCFRAPRSDVIDRHRKLTEALGDQGQRFVDVCLVGHRIQVPLHRARQRPYGLAKILDRAFMADALLLPSTRSRWLRTRTARPIPPHVQSLGRSAQRVRSRSIPLPPETVAALKAHRKAQLAEKMLLGPDYSDDDLVFCRGDGTKLHPTTFSRRFNQLAHSAKLRRIRLHDLRHTFATLALQAAVPVKIVSEILGHASVTLTYDTYSHVIPGMGEDATSKVAALVFGTRSLP